MKNNHFQFYQNRFTSCRDLGRTNFENVVLREQCVNILSYNSDNFMNSNLKLWEYTLKGL